MRTSLYFVGDAAYTGVQRESTIQQLFDTANPYLLRYLSESEREETNLEDARKTELSYLITNSIKMWLQSKVGDYGRVRPGMGGPLDEYIGKIISPDKAKNIETSLRNKIETTFDAVLTVDTLTVTPIPDKKTYQIYLVVTYLLIKKAFSINTEFKP